MPLIRRYGPFLPGGWPYTDPRTGHKFNGMEAGFDEQVGNILHHRLANPLVYPKSEPVWLTKENIQVELDNFQCERLNNDPRFCQSAPSNGPVIVAPFTEPKCGECGGDLKSVYCKTCSSFRVTGFKCEGCGKEYPKKKRR